MVRDHRRGLLHRLGLRLRHAQRHQHLPLTKTMSIHRSLLLIALPFSLALAQACDKAGDKPHTDTPPEDDTGKPDDSEVEDVDQDGDGITGADGDCDDDDAKSYPGALELCDKVDNDCDDSIDDGLRVCFYPTEGEGSSMEADFDAGSASSPAEILLTTAGTLVLGKGEWFVSLRISADVSVTGAGVDETTLSGGDSVSVILVEDDLVDAVTLSDLTLTNGQATRLHKDVAKYPAGGGLYCLSSSEPHTTLTLEGVSITASSAVVGSALYSLGCTVNINNSNFDGIDAITETAGVFLENTTATISNTTIQNFSATQDGGGVYVTSDASLALFGSHLLGNKSASSGGAIFNQGQISCAVGQEDGAEGTIQSNTEPGGGGVYIDEYDSAIISSTGCDWGSGTDDNSPDDVNGDGFTAGQSFTTESFTCTYLGCTTN
ncbi:MAG: hypothetical protein IPO67_31225 [Deltaproteobacteria bacterium]|nr:hypothetical protein [Deltaproteobacteria bacterium]